MKANVARLVWRIAAALSLVLHAGQLASQSTSAPARVSLTGTVFDSIRSRPLSRARVQLIGAEPATPAAQFAAETDSLGRFSVGDVPVGRYLAGFFHPLVDTVGLELDPVVIVVRERQQQVSLATPSQATIYRSLCSQRGDATGATAIFGRLYDLDTEAGLSGASVQASWPDFDIDGRSATIGSRSTVARTGQGGTFAICDLPADISITLRAAAGADTTGEVRVTGPSRAFEWVTLFLAKREQSPASSPRTQGRVEGRVLDQDRKPVANARIALLSLEREATTDSAGRFSLDRVPEGTQGALVRAIGYNARDVAFHVRSGAPSVEVLLERVQNLAPVITRSSAELQRRLDRFVAHKRTSGGGYFIGPFDSTFALDMPIRQRLAELPNVKVFQLYGEWMIQMAAPASVSRGRACTPSILVDGAPTSATFDALVTTLTSNHVIGVEVYNRVTQVPAEYPRPPATWCGMLVIWTK
jgi:hypothetical protein